MNRDERIYRALLRVYPRQFLEGYEREMLVAFRDQRRDAGGERSPWPTLLADIGRSAPIAWRDQLDDDLRTGLGAMKAMALLAMAIGIYETLNTITELNVGGVGGRSGIALIGLTLAVAAGIGLVVLGIVLIRRGSDATRLAIRACAVCFVLFGVTAVTRAGLSGMANLAGLAFPLILLGFLAFSRSSRAAS